MAVPYPTTDLTASDLGMFLLNKGEIFELTFTFPEELSLVGATALASIRLTVEEVEPIAVCTVSVNEIENYVVVTLPADVSAGLDADVEHKVDLRLVWSASNVRYPAHWRFKLRDRVTKVDD